MALPEFPGSQRWIPQRPKVESNMTARNKTLDEMIPNVTLLYRIIT